MGQNRQIILFLENGTYDKKQIQITFGKTKKTNSQHSKIIKTDRSIKIDPKKHIYLKNLTSRLIFRQLSVILIKVRPDEILNKIMPGSQPLIKHFKTGLLAFGNPVIISNIIIKISIARPKIPRQYAPIT